MTMVVGLSAGDDAVQKWFLLLHLKIIRVSAQDWLLLGYY